MEIAGDPPPIWPQLTNSFPRRRRPPSPLFTPPVLIILLPILALLVLFFAVPPFLSITTQIFRPYGVRKSWDSLNIFLVLFAILCGVFARRNDDVDDNNNNSLRNDNNNNNNNNNNNKTASHHVSQRWFDQYPAESKIYDVDDDRPITASETGVRRLKRSSSSYPDLRQESLWENNEDRFRFFDDFEISKYRSSANYNDRVHELRRTKSELSEESEAKVIPVDTFVLRSSPSSPPSNCPAPSTPPPPPPPPPAARHKPRRSYQAVGQREKVISQNDHKMKSPEPVTQPPPPPPPPRRPPSPLMQMGNRSEQKYAKLESRKSNATKEIKMVFASLRKRKKKSKTKDHDHHPDCPLHSPCEPPTYYSTTIPPPSSAPPPPPPPPPPSVFQKYNLFRKGSKSKKIHSVLAPPPPPPPPPAFSLSKLSSKQSTQIPPTPPPAPPPSFFSTQRLSKQKSQIPPPSKPPPAPPIPIPPPEPSRRRTTATTGRPPLPTKACTSYYEENLNSGGQSPLIPMPPPPPPPPFKMPEFKFVIRGDFVKIRSSPSSRCSSPDLDEVDVSSTKYDSETASVMNGGDGVDVKIGGIPVFCPSPDVNAKAETFIARLRDGWKLEKINSMKEKQRT